MDREADSTPETVIPLQADQTIDTLCVPMDDLDVRSTPKFLELPVEIRLMIWEAYLPEKPVIRPSTAQASTPRLSRVHRNFVSNYHVREEAKSVLWKASTLEMMGDRKWSTPDDLQGLPCTFISHLRLTMSAEAENVYKIIEHLPKLKSITVLDHELKNEKFWPPLLDEAHLHAEHANGMFDLGAILYHYFDQRYGVANIDQSMWHDYVFSSESILGELQVLAQKYQVMLERRGHIITVRRTDVDGFYSLDADFNWNRKVLRWKISRVQEDPQTFGKRLYTGATPLPAPNNDFWMINQQIDQLIVQQLRSLRYEIQRRKFFGEQGVKEFKDLTGVLIGNWDD